MCIYWELPRGALGKRGTMQIRHTVLIVRVWHNMVRMVMKRWNL